jgi:hypothetical protein
VSCEEKKRVTNESGDEREREKRGIELCRYLLHVNTSNEISDVTFSIFRSGHASPSLFQSKVQACQLTIFNAKEVVSEPTTIITIT